MKETRAAGPGAAADAGAAGLLALLAGVLVSAVGLAVVAAVADYGAASARARTAADAAALAAMAASPLVSGSPGNGLEDARAAAARLARANGATVEAVDGAAAAASERAAWPLGVAVSVAVAPTSALVRSVAPAVSARAAAAVRPPPAAPDLSAVWPAGASVVPTGSLPRGWRRPVTGPVTSPFGWRTHPVLGTGRLHAGVDFGAASGTPIVAAAGGTVVSAGWRGGYGLAVVIDHGGGLTSLYGHQSRLLARPGERVGAGQVIGLVGSTGMSTGPHLHFEVRVGGVPRDPLSPS